MNRTLVIALVCCACGTEQADQDLTAENAAPLRALQGRERQGRERQGTSLVGGDIRGWQLPSLRKPFPGEPLTAPADRVSLRQGELVLERSLAAGSTVSLTSCATLALGLNRACGWVSAGVGFCSPGVVVAIGSGGMCGGSACTGDTMIRVCAGSAPCEAGGAIAANDDACSSLCSYVEFTCPASGTFNVLSGSYASNAVTTPNLGAISAVFPITTVEHSGTSLSGATLDAVRPDGGTVTSRISGIAGELSLSSGHVHVGDGHTVGTTFRYNVAFRNRTNSWVPMCGGTSADFDGNPVAIPVQGYWNDDGSHVDDPSWATFACKPGVINKCYRWGYRPWDVFVSGPNQELKFGEQLHQTCTRMARADYCGDGRSFTQNGTEINVFDSLMPAIQISDPLAMNVGLTFEAAWTPAGAICLSHVRWSNAPPEVLLVSCKAPRNPQPLPGEDPRRFCGSQVEAEAYLPRPELFDDSQIHDGGVW